MHNSKKRDKRVIPWDPHTEKAFESIKNELANATLIVHPVSGAEVRLVTDASDIGMGAALEQRSGNSWQPLAFFSKKFTPAETRYSAYDRELTAIYRAIKHFEYFLRACTFKIVTDHKPLIFAFSQKNDKTNLRQQRQISFISQYTTQIEHISGEGNVVADTLSRVESVIAPVQFNLEDLSLAQKEDEELSQYLKSKKLA